MRILLTNDDGYDAPGLRALWEAVRRIAGAQISIAAPAVAFSGKGHAISPIVSCRTCTLDGIGEVTVVDGTPSDCVRVAVALPGHPRPDWVVSGINHGSNLGIDVFYSGTVAAAREAAILGIPAIAISQLIRSGCADDWPRTVREACSVLAALIAPEAPTPGDANAGIFHQARCIPRQYRPSSGRPSFWNINLPRPPDGGPPAGVQFVRLSTDPLLISYEHRIEAGLQHLTYTGKYHERPASPGTDVAAAFGGSIAISSVLI